MIILSIFSFIEKICTIESFQRLPPISTNISNSYKWPFDLFSIADLKWQPLPFLSKHFLRILEPLLKNSISVVLYNCHPLGCTWKAQMWFDFHFLRGTGALHVNVLIVKDQHFCQKHVKPQDEMTGIVNTWSWDWNKQIVNGESQCF